jgi:tetratricopeptide (TPR) repeat protein
MLALFSGCTGRTPEERLQQAIEYYKQQDALSAEAEAKKVIEKTAIDDPAGIQARMLMARIAFNEKRFDDAIAHIEPALDKVSQKEQIGTQLMQTYLMLLQENGRFDDALKKMDEMEKTYGNDASVMANLKVGRIDIQTKAGQTTAARTALLKLKDETTSPAELKLYRELIARTYERDKDTTGAIEFYRNELESNAKTDEDRRFLAATLAVNASVIGDYDKVRSYLTQATELYDKAVEAELNAGKKTYLILELAELYGAVGNLAAARRGFQSVYDTNPTDARIIQPLVMSLRDVLYRQGDYEAAIGFLKEAATKYPGPGISQEIAMLETLKAQNKLAQQLRPDTSTLTLRFKDDAPLVPKSFASLSTATATMSTVTTGCAALQSTGTAVQDSATTKP